MAVPNKKGAYLARSMEKGGDDDAPWGSFTRVGKYGDPPLAHMTKPDAKGRVGRYLEWGPRWQNNKGDQLVALV